MRTGAARGKRKFFGKISERQLIATSSTGDWIGRPSIINDGSKWIMFYRAGALHGYDDNSRYHVRFSTDEGVTWSDENDFTDGNPVTGTPFSAGEGRAPGTLCLLKAHNGDLIVLMSEREEVFTSPSVRQWRSTNAGATWSDEGVVADEILSMDAILVGTDMYATGYTEDDTRPGGGAKVTLWKSTNNGTNWTKVRDVTTWAEADVNADESSLCNPDGSVLIVAMRSRGAVQETYIRRSFDLGATWEDVIDIKPHVGIIQRPRLRIFADEPSRIYMIGRKIIGVDEWTIMSCSDNSGLTWTKPFELEDSAQVDCGYADFLKRDDGNIYAVTYDGNYSAATIYEYILDVK